MTVEEIAKMMDVSAVQAQNTLQDIDACCELAAEFGCAAVFCLPAHVPYLRTRLDALGLKVPMASVSGFPGGSETSRIKAATARELVEFGCDEVDMVNNVTWLKAGDKSAYVDDVAGVVEAAGGRPVKVILECHWHRLGTDRRHGGTHRAHVKDRRRPLSGEGGGGHPLARHASGALRRRRAPFRRGRGLRPQDPRRGVIAHGSWIR